MYNETPRFSIKNKYGSPIVGGKVALEDENYINTQSDIIRNQQQKILTDEYFPKNNSNNPLKYLPYGSQNQYGMNTENNIEENIYINQKKDEYNPLMYFLKTKGIDPNIRTKVKRDIFYVNIDSAGRKTEPTFTTNSTVNLGNNPLKYNVIVLNNQNTGVLTITHPNHNLSVGDRITLTGLEKTTVTISIFTYDINGIQILGVEFVSGSSYVKFNINPNMSSTSPVTNATISKYIQTDMFVSISGFSGYPTTTSLGNIPINFLNSTHQIYLLNPTIAVPAGNYPFTSFYIKLPEPFQGTIGTTPYNIDITFNHIGGIPINTINAEFPLSQDIIYPYQTITAIRSVNSYDIAVSKIPYYAGSFGGSNIYVSLIKTINTGYPYPNNYSITLGKTIYNAISVRLISSIFPNSAQVFKSSNNKLYWKNQDDGNIIYSVSIPVGNYSPDTLKQTLETQIALIPRSLNLNLAGSNTTYLQFNIMQVNIDLATNIVTFYSYKRANVIKPIIKVTPDILTDGSDPGTDTFILNIQQTKHSLSVGDSVLFSNFITHLGISDILLNTTHTVYSVIDADTYQIELKHINLFTGTRTSTGGGYATQINTPNKFQLLFNYQDTMGTQLGFRNVGEESSITPFSYQISNNQSYLNELSFDALGNPVDLTNDSVILSGDNYILMSCQELSKMTHIGKANIDNVFCKINLSGLPSKLLYDTYVPTPHIYENPIDITNLTFSFYSPTGELFDFNGLDHSFVLEIVTLNEIPDETENNSNTLQDTT